MLGRGLEEEEKREKRQERRQETRGKMTINQLHIKGKRLKCMLLRSLYFLFLSGFLDLMDIKYKSICASGIP